MCPKHKNPTLLMHIWWSWKLNVYPERHSEVQNLIFYHHPPPQMPAKQLCKCACVYETRWHYWSFFKHCPEPLCPSQYVNAPKLMKQSQLLADITTHISKSLSMIAMIWYDVFCDPPKPLSWHSGGLLPSSFYASGSVPNSPICSEWTPH